MSQHRVISRFLHFLHRYRLSKLNLKSKGKNVQISRGFKFSNPENITIGSNVHIGVQATIYALGGLIIGDGTIIGPRLTVYSANHRFRDARAIPYDDVVLPEQVEIGENTWIGGNVILVPGVTIGEGCIVAAGSVVTKDFPPCNVIGGNPARVIDTRDKNHYMQLKQEKQVYLALKREGLMNPHVER